MIKRLLFGVFILIGIIANAATWSGDWDDLGYYKKQGNLTDDSFVVTSTENITKQLQNSYNDMRTAETAIDNIGDIATTNKKDLVAIKDWKSNFADPYLSFFKDMYNQYFLRYGSDGEPAIIYKDFLTKDTNLYDMPYNDPNNAIPTTDDKTLKGKIDRVAEYIPIVADERIVVFDQNIFSPRLQNLSNSIVDAKTTATNALDKAETAQKTANTAVSMISGTNETFSNAVLAVGLNIDTNSVAVLNDIADTFGGFPIEGTATTVGGLLAALAASAAWLKKNKVGLFEPVGGASATVENGVAKLSDFFTSSNSLLTATIDAEVISKGTAPDAHLEAPTDEHLKLILADNSVAYDSAKALPYKLTSVIGDRVVATMTLTAASTDITLPTISANDTTVKDFILDVTNAYAVEGVATDAGINIPRTDFKLVTRDGESLTDVTTVKAGKSAFICFTQKSPVVVDGTTYPCWCVIQLPFGDHS